MVTKWPHRQHELAAYETDIARIHAFYGDRFYDYHLAFADKAAQAVKLGIPIDWSKRDSDLFQLILRGTRARQCQYCSSTLHETDFCDQTYRSATTPGRQFAGKPAGRSHITAPGTSQLGNDRYGRKISYHQGMEVCNNFNATGCTRRSCMRYHGCSHCMNPNHGRQKCPTLIKTTNIDNAHKEPATTKRA